MDDVRVDVVIKGPFFAARIDNEARRAIVVEVLDKVEHRVMRTPRSPKAGRKNNTLSAHRRARDAATSLVVTSTLNPPRTVGRAWAGYNMAAIRKLAPNVIRAAGRRLAQQLGGH